MHKDDFENNKAELIAVDKPTEKTLLLVHSRDFNTVVNNEMRNML